jgi:hypothetical protein
VPNRLLLNIPTIVLVLTIFTSNPDSAKAATMQQCAIKFALCDAQCRNKHHPYDIGSIGLCQAGCFSSRSLCESTASDRNAPAGRLTTQSPSGDKKPLKGGTERVPVPSGRF